jgi:NAD(P)-dependent dehydrogenase (short-subunit alcohol dehydrogenase family)
MSNENYKTAIITGGSRGLGRNTAIHLARRAVDILFTYRSNQKEADSLVREVEATGRKAAGFRLNTGDIHAFEGFAADVRKTLRGWGRERFAYLVNNAGGSLQNRSVRRHGTVKDMLKRDAQLGTIIGGNLCVLPE